MCIVVDLCRAMQGEHVSVLGKDALPASKGICMGSWEHGATVSLSGVVCSVSCTSACVSEHLCVCVWVLRAGQQDGRVRRADG